jgi:SAM-dependent methyltransferase
VFSFITAGGEFSLDYDLYMNTKLEGFWENKDIYDACKVKDLKQFIIKKPRYSFTFGLDYKSNLLKQASLLGFYGGLIKCDAAKCLPFDGQHFKTVFSNMLYWINEPRRQLKEIYRILDNSGTAIICLPNKKFFNYCFTYQWKRKRSVLLRLLNRGRSESIKWVTSYKDFSALARESGFKVIDHSYYLSPLTLRIWDIGLRPISPPLIKTANGLKKKDRRIIKKEWIDTLINILDPIYQMEINSKAEGGFHLFILKKS